MKVNSKIKTAGRALGAVSMFALDAPARIRIAEIDAEIEKLQAERTTLQEKLINKK